jgi:serine protease AprX
MSTYVAPTDWRLCDTPCGIRRSQKEVHVRAVLAKRDGFRFRAWQAGLVAVIFAMAFGMVRSGASWGSSGYDPASDPYSMRNITAADGAQAWWEAGYTGQGVDVALIDTGVSPVAGLNAPGKVVNGPDLSLESQNPNLQYLDTNGHGTFMAGLIAGNDGQPGGYRGVAPDARIVSLKVADADGGVDVSQVIAAIDWVVQHRDDNGMNIRVINLSYGTNSTQPYQVDPLAYAVEQAWRAGIVVVAAAGNSGFQRGANAQGLADPAYDPEILAVGAADTTGTSSNDAVGSFSANAASCSVACRAPDLLGPGTHMQGLRVPGSYIDQNNPAGVLGDSYFRGSGTSEATAFVSGAVALLLQKYPDLTPDQVKAMLTSNCDKLHGYNRKQQGCGELDLSQLLSAPEAQLLTAKQYLSRWGVKGLSTGTGSLEASRGTDHISFNGTELQGQQDIFGMPFDSAAMAAAEASGSSWSGGMWNGSVWTGSSWSGSSWSGSSWSGSAWPGSSWSGSSWSGSSWSGNSWSGSSWSGSSWSGSSWSGSSWSGNSWSGGSWLGASWG